MTDHPYDQDYHPGPLSSRAQERLFGVVTKRGRIVKDGDAWCATGPGFRGDFVMEAFGCGPTPEKAYEAWAKDAKKRPEWRGMELPDFDQFEID